MSAKLIHGLKIWGDHDWDVVHVALTQTYQPETIAWLDGTVGGRQPHGGRGSFHRKSLNSISEFQSAILMKLPHHCRPMGIRLLPDLAFEADQRALQEDLIHSLELFNYNDKAGAQSTYLAAFIAGVA